MIITYKLPFVLCCGIFACSVSFLHADENPFGEVKDPAAPMQPADAENAPKAPPVAGKPKTESPPLAPATAAILGSNPQTPTQFLRAIDLLCKLNEFEFAKKMFADFIATKPDDAALLAAYDELHSDLFLRLARQQVLQPAINGIVDQAIKLAKDRNENRERLVKLAQELTTAETAASQNDLLSQLLQAGEHGSAAVVASLANKDLSPAAKGRLFLALQKIGTPGLEPVIASLETDNVPQLVALYEYLGTTENPRNALWLFGAALANDSPQEAKVTASLSIHRLVGKLVDKASAIKLLQREANDYLTNNVRLKNDANNNIVIWMWDAAQKAAAPRLVPHPLAQAVQASRLANVLLQIDGEDVASRRIWLQSQLRVAAWSSGLDKPLVLAAPQLALLEKWGTAQLDAVLQSAMNDRDTVATAALAQALGQLAMKSKEKTSPPPALIAALRYGNRRVQFAATQAMANFEPRQSFAGAGEFMESVLHLARSTGQQRALVVFPNLETATKLGGYLSGLGWSADVATNGRDALRLAQLNPDYEVIMLSTKIDRSPTSFVYQGLRRDYRTAQTPIVILTEERGEELKLASMVGSDSLTQFAPRPLEEESTKYITLRVIKNIGFQYVTPQERAEHGRVALQTMAKMAEWNTTQYDFRPHVPLIANAMENVNLCETASGLLAKLGNHQAQTALIEYASRSEVPVPLRKFAATALGKSTQQYGVLLTKSEIVQQYNRYNASQKADAAVQQVLGEVLDAIEWPSKNKKN